MDKGGDRWKAAAGQKDDQDGSKPPREPNTRRKDRKNRRSDREPKKEADTEEFRILKPDKLPDAGSEGVSGDASIQMVAPASPVAKRQFFDKPKEEKVKKYSESRRERRATMRNQAAKEKSGDLAESGPDEEQRSLVKKEQPSDAGRATGRDRKVADNAGRWEQHDKETDERRSSVESNGGSENQRTEVVGTKVERDVARIRKKVSLIEPYTLCL